MPGRIRLLSFLGAAVVAAAILALALFLRPELRVHAFEDHPDFGEVAMLPLTESDETSWKRLIEDARQNPEEGHRLVHALLIQYGESGSSIYRERPGLYCGHCRRGPALVFHLDEQGFGYFAFVRIAGKTEMTLDREQNGVSLLHAAPKAL